MGCSIYSLHAFCGHLPTQAQSGRPFRHLVAVRLYVLSSRWDDEPIRFFQTQGEAEDALQRVAEDTLGLAADAFVTEAELDFKVSRRGPVNAEADQPWVSPPLPVSEPAGVPR